MRTFKHSSWIKRLLFWFTHLQNYLFTTQYARPHYSILALRALQEFLLQALTAKDCKKSFLSLEVFQSVFQDLESQ